MKGRLLTIGMVLALGCGAILAHGEKVHIKGKIEKISADSLQVKTLEGTTVEVKLTASTVYLLHVSAKSAQPLVGSPDKPATRADLSVGDTVVIHATPQRGNLEANEIKFSAASGNKASSPTPKPKP